MISLVYLTLPGALGIIALYLKGLTHSNIPSKSISYTAMGVTLLLLLLGTIFGFSGFNLVISKAIDFSISFNLNGISLPFLFLAVLMPMLVLPSFKYDVFDKKLTFDALFLVIYVSLISMFMSSNLLSIFIFMEISLLSAFFAIFLWGNESSFNSAMKFLIFTQISSMLILTAFLMVFLYTGSFELNSIAAFTHSANSIYLSTVFMLVLVAAIIKFPVFPLHVWMPGAYYDSATNITALLSGLFSKIGGYILLLFILFITPSSASYFSMPVMTLAVISAFYAAFVALSKKDLKMMFIYSSMLYMSLALMGIMSSNPIGIEGGIFLMISYGFISPLAFMLTGYLRSQTGTTDMTKVGGLMKKLPNFALFFFIVVFASIGVPGFSNFIGEFLVFLGAFKFYPLMIISIVSMLIATGYYLSAVKRIIFEKFFAPAKNLHDLSRSELIQTGAFSFVIIILGIMPYILVNSINLGAI
ncbi:MAG: complex I subunit 4 family protein [Candidatus Acidifodinimicrobium sp.]